jgi:choline dehydrogenase-like flavoprotein
MQNRERARVVIVGAGICGAATAYFLACAGETDIVVLEAEDAYNRHSSGRSASYFVPMYETWLQAHLAAAEPFLQSPPDGFTPYPLLDRRARLSQRTRPISFLSYRARDGAPAFRPRNRCCGLSSPSRLHGLRRWPRPCCVGGRPRLQCAVDGLRRLCQACRRDSHLIDALPAPKCAATG